MGLKELRPSRRAAIPSNIQQRIEVEKTGQERCRASLKLDVAGER